MCEDKVFSFSPKEYFQKTSFLARFRVIKIDLIFGFVGKEELFRGKKKFFTGKI